MRIVEPPDAGSPEEDITCTPGTVPASALVTVVLTLDSMASDPTMDAEPVNELLVAVPYAITIVSSMYSLSGSSDTLITDRPSAATSFVLYPIDENTRIPSTGMVIS